MVIKTLLLISLLVLIVFTYYIRTKENKQLEYKTLLYLLIALIIQLSGIILQVFLGGIYDIPLIYYEYISYIGGMFIGPLFIIFSISYRSKKILKKNNVLICIPVFFLIVLWTNDIHHLFYRTYSININSTEFGPLFIIYSIYSYSCMIISMILLIETSLKKSGFFSRQTALIILGCLFPLIPNILATIGIIKLTVYITPIMFTATIICFGLAIIKFKALNVTPVAFRTIIDTMVDGFVVVSDDGTIADMNQSFKNTFGKMLGLSNNSNLFDAIEEKNIIDIEKLKVDIEESKKTKGSVVREYKIVRDNLTRDFEIDIQPVKAKNGNEYVASLLYFRDITQQKKEIEKMTKNENLIILGELAGGVAHDINTPIAAIKSGILMLKERVTSSDEINLLGSMDRCADKIITLVNSMRNQIRNIGTNIKVNIKISDLIKDTRIIINNELMKNNIVLNVDIINEIIIKGEQAKLSQVITNLIINAIQAYEGKGGTIDIKSYIDESHHAIIKIKDYAGGIPETVREHIFKNILTTKGVSGTGFGLYLAYSIIKGSFGGEISFNTETGKGTEFIINIPLEDNKS
ncbi:MAG: histidine kinase N-terminal 7TM domain-containing protein [Clostridia bacterium]|nr:histidine kinase N-terminal 7TM domain-containing protein [Clostridia bacterium]MDD4375708.1 histidine kinase N-terminal 7TM domain-containing protein [Clostridia bacterium]